jgi:tetratricopeptide (TPR) repeat protein
MRIKSFILAAVFSASSLLVFAQKGELASAKSNYEKFVSLKEANSLLLGLTNINSAKSSIDKAVVNEKTSTDPASWTYKAMIYGELALLDTVPATSKPLFDAALSAHTKAVELDKAGVNKANLDNVFASVFSQYELNQGVKAYQTNNFEGAYNAFNNALTYRPGDTTITYYTGLSAINAKNYKAGISKYEDLIKTNFSANQSIYLDFARLYSMEGDTAKAISIASEGAIKFNDSQLATMEIEFSLMSFVSMRWASLESSIYFLVLNFVSSKLRIWNVVFPIFIFWNGLIFLIVDARFPSIKKKSTSFWG